MRLRRIGVATTVSGILLSACDFTAGIYRIARLDAAPLPICVQQTLAKAVGAANVKYTRTEVNGHPLHRFTYRAEGVDVLVDIEREADRPEYRHYYEVFNTVPPKALVDRLRPVMARVDRALENRCDIVGLSRKAEEYCSRGLFRSAECTP